MIFEDIIMKFIGKLYLLIILFVISSSNVIQAKPKLTLDEFFDQTTFSLLSFSPNGEYLLFESTRPSWNTSSYEHNLWIYDITEQTKKLIIKNVDISIEPRWSPSGKWIALVLYETAASNSKKSNYYRRLSNKSSFEEHRIHLYSLVSNELFAIEIGQGFPLALTWSDDDSSLYLASNIPTTNKDDNEWRDVIQYRENQKHKQSIIYRLNIDRNDLVPSVQRTIVTNVSFSIGKILYISGREKIIFNSLSFPTEILSDFELFSIDLQNGSTVTKLTNNVALENRFEISYDGQHVLFLSRSFSIDSKEFNDTQTHLFSLDLTSGQIIQLAKNFDGHIDEYAIRSDGGVYILGQLKTEVQIYLQRSLSDKVIHLTGWNGTYESLIVSRQGHMAVVHSSTKKPMEIYLITDINRLQSAHAITDDNKLFTERELPQTKIYQWRNSEDQQLIEGILHYPPGQFEGKNLPLFILIHGGPYSISINRLSADWYSWAPLAASEGWLVLEPNYRGSTGYGDQFFKNIRTRPLSLPGKDILYGVDQLIQDAIVDPHRLTVGGYSYGSFLTNWLIAQTKRFNAALSGAGAIEHLSAWGTMDLPTLFFSFFGGHPWEVPHIYQNEAPLYRFDQVHTPTLIVTGENDVRVPGSQSYFLERALHYRKIPTKLLVFPGEGHSLCIDPWHGKIKIREELKWLKKYGHL